MANEIPKEKRTYDLEERTAAFGEAVINFCKKLPENSITKPIISQLIRSGTSVGANYCEANDAETKKDFIHKIGISRKESHETKHWLRMMIMAVPTSRDSAKPLWQEAYELNLIFSSIIRSARES